MVLTSITARFGASVHIHPIVRLYQLVDNASTPRHLLGRPPNEEVQPLVGLRRKLLFSKAC